jgi:hypothetical protein
MLGSTQMVDMETTRKNNFGRVLVAVLNPSLILKELDVVIGDHYFELEFEVEKWGFDENGEEATFEWKSGFLDGEGEGEKGEGQERMAKKQKKVGSSGEREELGNVMMVDSAQVLSWKEQVMNMSNVEFEAFLKEKAGEILNKAAENIFDDLVDKVTGEEEGEQENIVNGVLSEMGKEGDEQNELQLGAEVPDASKMQVRASPRLQRSRDEHVLAKAEERVAKKNLEFSGGNSHSNSLITVNRDIAMNCLQQIGINLGESDKDRDNNLQSLFALELEREDIEFGGFEQDWLGSENDEENIELFELKALKSLCGELMDEVFDESSFPLNSELDDYKRKGKSHAKLCLKKTCKVRGTKLSKRCAKRKESFGIAEVLVTWLKQGS